MTDDDAAIKPSLEPGLGHNNPFADVVWERKTKHRIFVRALEGTYGNLVHELYSQPRVYRTRDLKWKGGPGSYGNKIINPQAVKVAQSIETHMEVYAPGGKTSKHGINPRCRPEYQNRAAAGALQFNFPGSDLLPSAMINRRSRKPADLRHQTHAAVPNARFQRDKASEAPALLA